MFKRKITEFNSAPLIPVNSVHSVAPVAAPNDSILKQFEVAAVSVPDPQNLRKNREGNVYAPQSDTIEAFESKFGAPVVGVQWHPEAYFWKEKESRCHRSLLLFMAKAGDAWCVNVMGTVTFFCLLFVVCAIFRLVKKQMHKQLKQLRPQSPDANIDIRLLSHN